MKSTVKLCLILHLFNSLLAKVTVTYKHLPKVPGPNQLTISLETERRTANSSIENKYEEHEINNIIITYTNNGVNQVIKNLIYYQQQTAEYSHSSHTLLDKKNDPELVEQKKTIKMLGLCTDDHSCPI